MRTLEHWKNLLEATPVIIECKEMQLQGWYDTEPPVFIGPGRIVIRDSTTIDFTMHATAENPSDAFRRLISLEQNPYDERARFRLFATDYRDTEWACGWTTPKLKGDPKSGFPLTGTLDALVTQAVGPWVSDVAGVELVFQPPFHVPMNKAMDAVVTVDGEEIERSRGRGRQDLHVLGSDIAFFNSPSRDALWVTATFSDKMPAPFLENWLSEPLRILFGQLLYPRFVARNSGDGKAQVWLRPSPNRLKHADFAGMIAAQPQNLTGAGFWALYENILTMIANDGVLATGLDQHIITRHYEEIILATQGSRWVMCLTMASVAEALARMLMSPDEPSATIKPHDVDSLRQHIEVWKGDDNLRSRVIGTVVNLGKANVAGFLRTLHGRGIIEGSQEAAWSKVRNSVMHGNLVSPWSNKEDDSRMLELAGLVHRLTGEIVRRRAPS